MSRNLLHYERSRPANGNTRNFGFVAMILTVTSVLCCCGASRLDNGTRRGEYAALAAGVTGLVTLALGFVFSSVALHGRGRSRATGICALALASIWSVVLFVLLFG